MHQMKPYPLEWRYLTNFGDKIVNKSVFLYTTPATKWWMIEGWPVDTIAIKGARTHNLKDIDLKLPRDQLIVITGLSGSGKSSLAFDTLYAEGQRRYVE